MLDTYTIQFFKEDCPTFSTVRHSSSDSEIRRQTNKWICESNLNPNKSRLILLYSDLCQDL